MLTIDQVSTVEALLMSRSHPLWGEFMSLAQVIGAVQMHKTELIQAANADPARRTRPAAPPELTVVDKPAAAAPAEPAAPAAPAA